MIGAGPRVAEKKVLLMGRNTRWLMMLILLARFLR